jgi:hypothetical protein
LFELAEHAAPLYERQCLLYAYQLVGWQGRRDEPAGDSLGSLGTRRARQHIEASPRCDAELSRFVDGRASRGAAGGLSEHAGKYKMQCQLRTPASALGSALSRVWHAARALPLHRVTVASKGADTTTNRARSRRRRL